MTATAVSHSPKPKPNQQLRLRLPAFLRDVRVIAVIAQIVFVILFVGLVAFIAYNVNSSLVAKGIAPNYSYLAQRAGFDISEAPDWYSPELTYWSAYRVGIENTLQIVIPGLFFSTLIGLVIGVALLSRNFMVRTVSAAYVEVLRNTALLVQLFFWYFVVMFSIPLVDATLPNEGIISLPLRVIAYPALWAALLLIRVRWRMPAGILRGSIVGALLFELLVRFLGYGDAPALVLGIACVGVVVAVWRGLIASRYRGLILGLGLAGVVQLIGLVIVQGMIGAGVLPASVTFWEIYPAIFITRKGIVFPEIHFGGAEPFIVLPQKPRFQFEQGVVFSPEFMALFIGLVIYTSAFIGEIVRAGIQAVPFGQIEAARSLGLSPVQTLRLIVLPQALRVIVPPLSSQYLNLAKNSTLATAVAYADAYRVGQTIMNQSGQSVTGFIMILLTYLAMSLVVSVIMNIINSRYQLVTR